MLLSFDVLEEAIAEHDEWHTHEHLPERLSLPGFLRGTRWVAVRGQPRYLVVYEVDHVDALASGAYLERLNNPTPWTSRMMPHYRGMTRGLCSVVGSCGFGMGHLGLLIRFKPAPEAESALGGWLAGILPRVATLRGVGSAHLLKGALPAQMTNEQRMRGADANVDWALLVTGYSEDALEALGRADLASAQLEQHGATAVGSGLYRTDYMLTAGEVPRC